MRCPRCQEVAPEGAAICDSCNEILDASFLEEGDPPVAGERTEVGPPPTAATPGPRATSGLRPARLTQRGGWNARPGGLSGTPPAEKRPYLAPPPEARAPSPLDEAHRTASDLGAFFRSLSAGDRLAASACAALLLLLGLPWRWTRQEEETIGLVAAWPVAFLAAGILGLVYVRARRADASLSRRLRAGQACAASVLALFTGLFLPFVTEQRTVRAAGLAVALTQSRPEVGAYLGLVCAVLALLGSLPMLLGERAQ